MKNLRRKKRVVKLVTEEMEPRIFRYLNKIIKKKFLGVKLFKMVMNLAGNSSPRIRKGMGPNPTE